MREKLRFYTKHSLNDLSVNRQRTVFALLCIAAGVAAVVSLQTLGVMMNDTLTGSLQEANGGDIRIFSGAGENVPEDVRRQGRDEGVLEPGGQFFPDYFGQKGLDRIQSWFDQHYPGEAEITYQQTFSDLTIGTSVSLPAKDREKTFVSTFIIDAQKYPLYGRKVSVDGRPLRDLLQQSTDIVLSENLADDLGAEVGDTVRVSGASVDFTVRGIVPTDAEGGIENLFAGLFGYYYLDQKSASYFSQKPATYDIFVRLKDPTRLTEINTAFKKDFPYLTTTTTLDVEERNSQVSNTLNDLVTVMGLVSLLIGGIGIVNTMLVIVSRRAAEVAILKTLGLEPQEITLLFLVEAILMGMIGSLGGVVLGWGLAFATKGVAERFLARPLAFHIAPYPAITGFLVGILVTTLFGFLPTLAAGQIRPAMVLRPTESIVPKTGRLVAGAAVLVTLIALSGLTQSLLGSLLSSATYRIISGGMGLISGGIIGIALATSSLVFRRRPEQVLLVAGMLALGFVLGFVVPALLLLTAAFVLILILYSALWALIWAIGGGTLAELPLMGRLPLWLRWLVLPPLIFFTLFLLPFWVLWGLGRLIQRFGFIDLKIAMRSMLANKGRGASTLLALSVGVFTLSLITMLVSAISQEFEKALEREAGGNVFILSAGHGQALDQVKQMLSGMEGVKSYAVVGSYNTRLVSVQDAATGQTFSYEELKQKVTAKNKSFVDLLDYSFKSVDARELNSNLPDVRLYKGRHLTPEDAGKPVIVIEANPATLAAGLKIGDLVTFELIGDGGKQNPPTATFEVVGMVDRRSGGIQTNNARSYAPLDAFPSNLEPDQVTAVVDIDPAQIKTLRRAVSEIPGTFVLETRFINEVLNRLISQFTSFPILVAALSLFTGGIVIANSVALSTMERRREIGIMKAVGLQRERVLGMLLLETAFMGFIGGLIGVGVGVLILITLLAGLFGSNLASAIPYGAIFALMGLCVGIALAAAITSVWNASGEKPLNVLRYE